MPPANVLRQSNPSSLSSTHPSSNYVPRQVSTRMISSLKMCPLPVYCLYSYTRMVPNLNSTSPHVVRQAATQPSRACRHLLPNSKNIPKNRVNGAQLARVTGATRRPHAGGGPGKVLPRNSRSVTRSVQKAVFRGGPCFFGTAIKIGGVKATGVKIGGIEAAVPVVKFGGVFRAAVHCFAAVGSVARSSRRGGGRRKVVPAEKDFHEAFQKNWKPVASEPFVPWSWRGYMGGFCGSFTTHSMHSTV